MRITIGGTCRECRHWAPPDFPHSWPFAGECRLERDADDMEASSLGLMADGGAHVCVGPDFGCIHWEGKP